MPNNKDILHPVTISQVMINFASELGVDAEVCLMGTDIGADALHEGEAFITREQEMRLIENLMLALPDVPALGLKLGSRYNVSTFGIWGFAMRTSRNLKDALTHALRFLPLSTAYCQIGTFQTSDSIGITMDASDIPEHLRQFLLERDMATGINLLRELSLNSLPLKRVELKGPRLDYADEITQFCGVEPHFNCEANALLVDRFATEKTLPTYDAYLVRMLEDQCRQQLERRQQNRVTESVRELLLGPLGLAANIDDVAQALHLSTRSLRRKLEAEDTSFRHLLESERKHLATQLLAGSRMTLDELALHLGYSETASFTRAFRRWTGTSPGEFRKSRLPGCD